MLMKLFNFYNEKSELFAVHYFLLVSFSLLAYNFIRNCYRMHKNKLIKCRKQLRY